MRKERFDELGIEELRATDIEELPERSAMSLVNANLAVPVNLALAANVLSHHAVAGANAQQMAAIGQSN